MAAFSGAIVERSRSVAWAGLSPFFVERASWRVGQGLSLEAAGPRSVADRLGVRQG